MESGHWKHPRISHSSQMASIGMKPLDVFALTVIPIQLLLNT